MAFSMLPSLRPGDWRAVICVRVVRKWSYRGGTDDGPVQHVDLVLVDQEGNSLYGEIPGPDVEEKSPLIDEGGVYVISRFRVSNAKSAYRAVDAPFMVEFTLHTTVAVPTTDVAAFPKYAYKITPIHGLPAFTGDTKNFLDTIGTLVEVSDIQNVHLPNKTTATVSRHIILRDLSYSELKVTLWGQRATTFTTQGVYDKNEAKPIIVLFVGGLMKSFKGNYYLSGNAACHWYFNPDIPEAQPFYDSYQNQRLEIRSVGSPVQHHAQVRTPALLEEKNLSELNRIDPYKFGESSHRCTVTMGRLLPNARWWFPSCTKCGKSCAPDGDSYRSVPCSNPSFKFKYKVCFTALDGTDEAEMVVFGDVARRIIGKPVQQLLRTSTGPTVYPPEIARLVSLRLTFAVTMSLQRFYKAKKTYNVASVVTAHGQPIAIPEGAESDNSSGHSEGQAGTINTIETSLGSSKTPPPSLETPTSKKHARGKSSKGSNHPSCRRKILHDSPPAATAADNTTPVPTVEEPVPTEKDAAETGESSDSHSALESG